MAEDALNALKMLSGGSPMRSQFQAAPTPRPAMRNQTRVDVLRKMLGLGGEDPNVVGSQQDLEDTYAGLQQEQDSREAQDADRKMKMAAVGPTIQGQTSMGVQGLENQGSLERAKVTGQYGVEAAKQYQGFQAGQRDLASQDRLALEQEKQRLMSGRGEGNARSVTLRQRLNALQTGKAHAAAPGGIGGFFGMGQKDADQKEIQQLMAELDGGGGNTSEVVMMKAPDGRVIPVPIADVAEAESLGAVRQ